MQRLNKLVYIFVNFLGLADLRTSSGQLYEKKSKKKISDASEEHTRYINLISALGPEISQEK